MKLTNAELSSITSGAVRFEETEDGYLYPHQYTPSQIEYFKGVNTFWYERSTASNARTIEFVTDSKSISFDYKIIWFGSADSLELYVDGIATKIVYIDGLDREGTLGFDLAEGQKRVTIYMPVDCTMLVRNFSIDGTWQKVCKKAKILWLGDSITQGYGPLRSACSYVSVANRILDCEVVNQGIGSYKYDKNAITPIPDFKPDRIIVSMGTNQYNLEGQDVVIKEYYDALTSLYPDTPILCITPIWRGDTPEGEYDVFLKIRDTISTIAEAYPNVSVADGFTFVPHLTEYFMDKLHPNALGCELYGANLAEYINKTGFLEN